MARVAVPPLTAVTNSRRQNCRAVRCAMSATIWTGLGVHVVLDNLSAHSTPEIKTWLAHRGRRLRRGTFTSVTELSEAITLWVEHVNADPRPFI